MKKKLKVEKAFRGRLMRRPTGPINPLNSTPFPRQPVPIRPELVLPVRGGPINTFNSTPFPRPSPIVNPGPQQPVPRDPNMFSTTPPRPGVQPSSQIDPNSPRSLPFASGVGPSMQGVGDPRLGAPMIPGNQLQMQMRGPTQTMKKGGAVRGVRIALRGAKKIKIY